MAIDGRIKTVDEDGKDLILTLESRGEGSSRSIAGQDILTIEDFNFKPEVGDEVWGGDTFVHVERKNGRNALHYWRVGYSRLREDHDFPFRTPQSPRFA